MTRNRKQNSITPAPQHPTKIAPLAETPDSKNRYRWWFLGDGGDEFIPSQQADVDDDEK